MDDNIGRLLDYLEANNLLENTLIVYTSDQGFYMGEHGWFDKRFMYEESLNTISHAFTRKIQCPRKSNRDDSEYLTTLLLSWKLPVQKFHRIYRANPICQYLKENT